MDMDSESEYQWQGINQNNLDVAHAYTVVDCIMNDVYSDEKCSPLKLFWNDNKVTDHPYDDYMLDKHLDS